MSQINPINSSFNSNLSFDPAKSLNKILFSRFFTPLTFQGTGISKASEMTSFISTSNTVASLASFIDNFILFASILAGPGLLLKGLLEFHDRFGDKNLAKKEILYGGGLSLYATLRIIPYVFSLFSRMQNEPPPQKELSMINMTVGVIFLGSCLFVAKRTLNCCIRGIRAFNQFNAEGGFFPTLTERAD